MDVRAPSHQKLQTRQIAICSCRVKRSPTIPAATSVRHSPSLNQHNTRPQPLQQSQPHQTTRIHSTSHQPSTKHSMQPQSQAQPPPASPPQAAASSRSAKALTRLEHGRPRPEPQKTPNTTNRHLQLPCEQEPYNPCSNKRETQPLPQPTQHTAAAPATITTASNNPHPQHFSSTLNQTQHATAISIAATTSIAATSGNVVTLINSTHLF